MISHMLDTNSCIDIIRGEHPHLLTRLNRYDPENVGISSIVFAELHTGVCKSSKPAHNLEKLTDFCTPLVLVPFDSLAAESYGFVRTALEAAGTPIGPLDTLIAAHALACQSILVTNNEKEFARVPGLQIENWLTAP